MRPMPHASTSLRERSKAKRRDAIQRAAMHLFAERGYDGATIADIAELAELAPRTVSLYFPNKIDIATSVSGDIAARLTGLILEHRELSFTDLVERWLAEETATIDSELGAMITAMYQANPGLRAVSNSSITEAAQVGLPAMLAEIGRSAEDPMLPIIGATVGAALNEYFSAILKSGGTPPELYRSFMHYLRNIIAAAKPT